MKKYFFIGIGIILVLALSMEINDKEIFQELMEQAVKCRTAGHDFVGYVGIEVSMESQSFRWRKAFSIDTEGGDEHKGRGPPEDWSYNRGPILFRRNEHEGKNQ